MGVKLLLCVKIQARQSHRDLSIWKRPWDSEGWNDLMIIVNLWVVINLFKALSWLGSYGSWIYNDIVHMQSEFSAYHHCSCEFESRSCEVYSIKFISDLRQVSDFLWELHQYNWQPQYNWNIVESGVKHHNPYPILLLYYLIFTCNDHWCLSEFCQ